MFYQKIITQIQIQTEWLFIQENVETDLRYFQYLQVEIIVIVFINIADR